MKISLTPAGIEPATLRFVAQHLNHCATGIILKWALNKAAYCGLDSSGSGMKPVASSCSHDTDLHAPLARRNVLSRISGFLRGTVLLWS